MAPRIEKGGFGDISKGEEFGNGCTQGLSIPKNETQFRKFFFGKP
jgi:hypothetical protein